MTSCLSSSLTLRPISEWTYETANPFGSHVGRAKAVDFLAEASCFLLRAFKPGKVETWANAAEAATMVRANAKLSFFMPLF